MSVARLASKLGMAAGISLLSFLTFVGSVVTAKDAPKQGITVSPSFRELIIGPGLLEAKTTVTVTNNTNNDLNAQLKLVDFDALNEFGGVSFGESGKPLSQYSLLAWMRLPEGETVTLPAGKETTIPVAIKNDDRLSPGGHYGAVIVSVSGGQSAQDNAEVTFRQEVASLLFVKKTGGETYGIQLEEFRPNNLPNIPQTVTMKFKGTGNVHVAPRGYIEVKDPKDVLVAKGIINPESTLVLPNKSRFFTTAMQSVAEPKAKGIYTITAFYRHDDTQEFRTEVVTFNRGTNYVSTGIILLVVGLLTGIVVVFYNKKTKKKFRQI